MTWTPPPPPPPARIGPAGWALAGLRGVVMAVIVFGGLALLLALRVMERPLCRARRPITPWITVAVCRAALAILGLRVARRGRPMAGQGALVANHVTWLDIFVLNAQTPLYFVAKAEVAGWPGIGWLARATGTLFVRRDAREARVQSQAFETRLIQGHRMLFFPEGTSTDGQRVLSFKSTLFSAFYQPQMRHAMQVQAVSVIYHAPPGRRTDFYGWWGDMDFAPSLVESLALWRPGWATVAFHPPVRVDAFPNRKSLAKHLEDQVRDGHNAMRDTAAGG